MVQALTQLHCCRRTSSAGQPVRLSKMDDRGAHLPPTCCVQVRDPCLCCCTLKSAGRAADCPHTVTLLTTWYSCSWTLLTNCTTVDSSTNVCFTIGLQSPAKCSSVAAASTALASELLALGELGTDPTEGSLCPLGNSTCLHNLTCTAMPVRPWCHLPTTDAVHHTHLAGV